MQDVRSPTEAVPLYEALVAVDRYGHQVADLGLSECISKVSTPQ